MKFISILIVTLSFLSACTRNSNDNLVVDPIRGSLGIAVKTDITMVQRWVEMYGGDVEVSLRVTVQEDEGGYDYDYWALRMMDADQLLNSSGVLEFTDLVEGLRAGEYTVIITQPRAVWKKPGKKMIFSFDAPLVVLPITIENGKLTVFEFTLTVE